MAKHDMMWHQKNKINTSHSEDMVNNNLTSYHNPTASKNLNVDLKLDGAQLPRKVNEAVRRWFVDLGEEDKEEGQLGDGYTMDDETDIGSDGEEEDCSDGSSDAVP
ncbi:hypothetical protein BS17DRAFT_766439 [Gyrodon lividus]|nr:hypothetical protein BS17DRAFT_766439 [Gyrodon lividus]